MPIIMPDYTTLTFQNGEAPPLDAANMQALNDMAAALSRAKIALAANAVTVTLAAAGWSGTTVLQQTVSAQYVTGTNTVLISPDTNSYADYTENMVRCTAQGDGSLTFTCEYQPTANIVVNVVAIDSVQPISVIL